MAAACGVEQEVGEDNCLSMGTWEAQRPVASAADPARTASPRGSQQKGDYRPPPTNIPGRAAAAEAEEEAEAAAEAAAEEEELMLGCI